MSEPTLRTLTLNYYREQGGLVMPLDTCRRRWEIRLDGQELALSFELPQQDPAFGACAPPEAVVPGSPKWGEILTDCIERGAVSYRHVVSAPIADPTALLAPAIPHGWAVASFRLARVTTRMAVAFTHRITYCAPAFSSQPDELHHDVLDARSGERLSALSDGWSSFATIPMGSPGSVPGIERLHACALALVDARSTDRGNGIEMSLQAKLHEVERRLQQHYVELRAEVQAREVADLSQRLGRIVEEIKEAAHPELSRLKEEGAIMAKRLDQAKKGRSVSISSLEKIEADALAAERERYEITLTTELVGLCIATFDQVTYEFEIIRDPVALGYGESDRVRLGATYVPVMGELFVPNCQACGSPAVEPVVTATREYCCRACTRPCESCGRTALAGEAMPTSCHACGKPICYGCGIPCRSCDKTGCRAHMASCGGCGDSICNGCQAACHVCDRALCQSCSRQLHGRTYCPEHIAVCERCGTEIPADLAQRCHLSGAAYCVACAMACLECGRITRRDLLLPAGRGLVCPDHLVSCGTCSAALLPREASLCASCSGHHCPDEAPGCPECGLPTCGACRVDGRCGVCSQLEEVAPEDERLDPVRSAVGDAIPRRWLLARAAGGHVVVEWHGRLGSWGRAALAPDGALLTSHRYGPVAALFQEVAGLMGR